MEIYDAIGPYVWAGWWPDEEVKKRADGRDFYPTVTTKGGRCATDSAVAVTTALWRVSIPAASAEAILA